MARPFWSGQLQISLVSVGIKLIPATESKSEIRFHQIDRRTGERVRHQNVSSTNEEPVEKGDIVKGYEYSKGKFIQLDPAEIEQVRIASRHAIEIQQFVDKDELDPSLFEKPYFVMPENPSQAEAFAVIRKALQETGKVGIGKIAFGGRERLIAVSAPRDEKLPGIMAYTLRFAAELRSASEYFQGLESRKVDPDQLSLAKELIKRKTAKFEPDKFTDNYEAALRELIEAKLKHIPLPREEKRAQRGKVVNLMDALRRSLDGRSAEKKPAVRAEATSPKKRTAGHGLKLMHSNSRTAPRQRKSA